MRRIAKSNVWDVSTNYWQKERNYKNYHQWNPMKTWMMKDEHWITLNAEWIWTLLELQNKDKEIESMFFNSHFVSIIHVPNIFLKLFWKQALKKLAIATTLSTMTPELLNQLCSYLKWKSHLHLSGQKRIFQECSFYVIFLLIYWLLECKGKKIQIQAYYLNYK